jgi:hypothetical protein
MGMRQGLVGVMLHKSGGRAWDKYSEREMYKYCGGQGVGAVAGVV